MKTPTAMHLLRRFMESVRVTSLSVHDMKWVEEHLTSSELELFNKMQVMDKTHSVGVARRLLDVHPDSDRFAVAAALLHDVGKAQSCLGVMARVAATILGPRTSAWRDYRNHEQIGRHMCRAAGIDSRVCDLVGGGGPDRELTRLREADDL